MTTPTTNAGYDIALSFASEEREYVELVANSLKENDVSVFYDKFEEAQLWGKDLYVYLNEIYKKRAKYTIMFISENYARKLWTNHERKSMQERAFIESEEYILPARFDDTEIPGLSRNIGYISLENRSPEAFSDLILEKLQVKRICNYLESLQNTLLSISESGGVRAQAAIALGKAANRFTVPALTNALLNDESSSVRAHSAIALKKIGCDTALSALGLALKNDLDDSVKAHCSIALGTILENRSKHNNNSTLVESKLDFSSEAQHSNP